MFDAQASAQYMHEDSSNYDRHFRRRRARVARRLSRRRRLAVRAHPSGHSRRHGGLPPRPSASKNGIVQGDERRARGSALRPRRVRRRRRMTANALLLDTKAWILAIEGSENGYAEALATARPAIVPGLVLAEVDYWLKRRRRV